MTTVATHAVHFNAAIEPAGLRFDVPMGLSILHAGLRAGVRLPSSCRNGTCRACMCRMLSGEVRYSVEWPGLSAEEKQEGFILPCVAHPMSNVRLDAPRAVDENATDDR
jgi:ferredoxin